MDLEADGRLGVRMDLAFVDNLPSTVFAEISDGLAFFGGVEDLGLGAECVANTVVGVTDGMFGCINVGFGHRVELAIKHRVNAHAEQVLMVLGIDLRSNHGTIRSSIFINSKDGSVELTGSLDLSLIHI